MLVCEGGASTGAISAGCLESDVIEHAKRVIRTGVSKIVEYNTGTTSDEIVWGLGLGCNGIVRVLVEPLATDSLYVEALRRSCEPKAAPVLVAIVYRLETVGRMLIDDKGKVRSEKLTDALAAVVESEMRAVSTAELNSGARILDVNGAAVTVFIEMLMPPVPIVIFGAGHDALPIVELARGLGWQTTVIDPHARHSSFARFAIADHVILSRPADAAAKLAISPHTLTLLMTHNYSHDLALLRFLLDSRARYIGVMGPRARTERMLSALAANEEIFRLHEADLSRVYAPAGLDIGANSSAEIAVSIVAEMRAVLEGRRGGMLRERRGSIHGSTAHVQRAPVTEQQALTMAVA
jgi:xanthine/CO dehydrogenase XdhC/CoxF family maturation factor